MRCTFWTLLYKNFRLRPCEQTLRSTAYTRTAVSDAARPRIEDGWRHARSIAQVEAQEQRTTTTTILLASKHTQAHSHNAHLHKHSKNIRGRLPERHNNTYQCWPPLQLNDTICSVLFFSRPRSEGWPHHGRTFSIYLCPLSF